MKLNLVTVCDTALALLLLGVCWGVGGAWLAVPVAALALWALRNRNDRHESEAEREEGLRRVRAQFQKDLRDGTGVSPTSPFFDLK